MAKFRRAVLLGPEAASRWGVLGVFDWVCELVWGGDYGGECVVGVGAGGGGVRDTNEAGGGV